MHCFSVLFYVEKRSKAVREALVSFDEHRHREGLREVQETIRRQTSRSNKAPLVPPSLVIIGWHRDKRRNLPNTGVDFIFVILFSFYSYFLKKVSAAFSIHLSRPMVIRRSTQVFSVVYYVA